MDDFVLPAILQRRGEAEPDLSALRDPVSFPVLFVTRTSRRTKLNRLPHQEGHGADLAEFSYPSAPLPLPFPPIFLPGTYENEQSVQSTMRAMQGLSRLLEQTVHHAVTPDPPDTSPGVTPRPDVRPQSGGRSGQFVPGLSGPPQSAIPSESGERIWVTDSTGKVIADISRKRLKAIKPGRGAGKERPPTEGENKLLDAMKVK